MNLGNDCGILPAPKELALLEWAAAFLFAAAMRFVVILFL
jgi:hypothetical protein